MMKTIAPFVVVLSFFLAPVFLTAQETPATEEKPAAPATETPADSKESTKPAAEERLPIEKTAKDSPVMKNLQLDKKISGRLPDGYRVVITDSQRDEIYKIQIEYAEIIELLKLRIRLLEAERDQKVDDILTAEQAAKIRSTLGVLESEKKGQEKPKTPSTRQQRR
ncbi:MAG: hypothetical protein ACRCUY_07375 [Thermoguttaceae bacterium]